MKRYELTFSLDSMCMFTSLISRSKNSPRCLRYSFASPTVKLESVVRKGFFKADTCAYRYAPMYS